MDAWTLADFRGLKFLTPDGNRDVPINSLWISDCCWEFQWDFKNVPLYDTAKGSVKDSVKERLKEIGEIEDFYFEIQKLSSETFRLDLGKVIPKPFESRDKGTVLEVVVILYGQREIPRRMFMNDLFDKVSAFYNIDHMANINECRWMVRCVLKQHEMTVLDTEARHEQEQRLIKELRSIDETEFREQLKNMSYLLQRESLKNIHSGRQTYQLAFIKTRYIQRTFKYATEIATKIRAKLNGRPYEQQTPVDVYLGYIFKNELRCIDEREVLELFINAHKFGLMYLIHECIELITHHLDDEYIIDAIIFAEMVHDSGFLSTLYMRFAQRYERVRETLRFKILMKNDMQTVRIILDSLLRIMQP